MARKSIQTLLKEMAESEKKGFLPSAMVSCRQAMRLSRKSELDYYYKLRMRYADYLTREDPVPVDFRERAIGLLLRLEKVLPRRESYKLGKCQMFLASCYQYRQRGSSAANLAKAKRWYKRAKGKITLKMEPKGWALLRVALGEVHANLAALGIDRNGNLREAYRLTRESLKVYTAVKFPEHNRVYKQALEYCKRELGLLKNGKGVSKVANA